MKAQAQTIIRAAAAITIGSLAAVGLGAKVYTAALAAQYNLNFDDRDVPECAAATLDSAEPQEIFLRAPTGLRLVRVSAV